MDYAKLKQRQKASRESKYLLTDEQAEDQIFNLIDFYDIDLTFDIAGLLDEENDAKQMSKEEKAAGIGVKQILKDVGHWIKQGVIDIERKPDDLIVTHNLIKPIGEESVDSTQKTKIVYRSITPKDTENMAKLGEDFTFAQRAETLMAYLSDEGLPVINALGVLDKRAARNVGILLLIAQ